MSIQLQHGEERFLWHLNVSDLLHTFLASLLFLQQFALTAHVAMIFAPIAAWIAISNC